jgi:ABC-type transporter Mla MlaB component
MARKKPLKAEKKPRATRKPPRAMGDDPLAWITESDDAAPPAAEAKTAVGAVAPHREQAVTADAPLPDTQASGQLASTGNDDGEVIIELETTLGIGDAGRLYQKLAATMEEKRAVVFDGSRIEMVDTAVLQLLAAFMRARQDDGVAVRWQTPSQALRRTATLLDLGGHLGLASADNVGPSGQVPA